MYLSDVGMVAADTSRTRAYLRALIRHGLLPAHVILLEHSSGLAMPGQSAGASTLVKQHETAPCWSEADFDPDEPLKPLLEHNQISYETAPSRDINNPAIAEIVSRRPESIFIFSGYGGVLLRREILATRKRFLHVHGGYLPAYKGSTTNYFSLLAEGKMGASSIFLNESIDSGPILMRQEFPSPPNRLQIDHLYDAAARAKVLIDTLRRHVVNGTWEFDLPNNEGGETYYIIHPVLKHVAILEKRD